MFVVTTETVPNHRVPERKGAVFGIVLHQYTELPTKARHGAIERMFVQARQMGAKTVGIAPNQGYQR